MFAFFIGMSIGVIVSLAWKLYRANKAGQFWCDGFYQLLDVAVDTSKHTVCIPVDVYKGKIIVEKNNN